MIKRIFIAIVLVAILGIGGYFVNMQKNNSHNSQGHNMENMDNKLVAQSHRSYEMDVISKQSIIKPKMPAIFRYKIKNDKGEILKDFATVHEKIMHFIVVRKDLQHFQHLHPTFDKTTGEFSIAITFPEDGPYRIFPDFTPGVGNPQKLPVTVHQDISIGDEKKYTAKSVTLDTQTTKTYGEYEVATTFPKNPSLDISYSLNISKNGTPVTNLENYLGALGHSVIIKEGSLDFIHSHALESGSESAGEHDMGAMQKDFKSEKGPDIKFSTTFPGTGIYKIFTQFQHLGKVITSENVIAVK